MVWLEKERQELADAAASAEKAWHGLLEKQRRLEPPGGEWEASANVQLTENFDDLYETYRRTFEDERRLAHGVPRLRRPAALLRA